MPPEKHSVERTVDATDFHSVRHWRLPGISRDRVLTSHPPTAAEILLSWSERQTPMKPKRLGPSGCGRAVPGANALRGRTNRICALVNHKQDSFGAGDSISSRHVPSIYKTYRPPTRIRRPTLMTSHQAPRLTTGGQRCAERKIVVHPQR